MKTSILRLTSLLAGLLASTGLLAEGPRSPSMLANTCAGCHGTNGASAGDAMPTIGGLDKRYLANVLGQFKSGARDSTIMGRIMKGYSDDEIKAIADHMASQTWVPAVAKVDPKLVQQGSKIHNDAKCETCHEKNGQVQDAETPRVAGQWPDYTYNMLVIYHDVGAPASQPRKMRERVQKLSLDELKAVAHFYAAQDK